MKTHPTFALAAGFLWLAVSAGDSGSSESAEPELPQVAVVRSSVLAGEKNGAPVYRKEFFSPTFLIDRIYTSMKGPSNTEVMTLFGPGHPSELVWLTGYKVEMVSPDGGHRVSDEFLCHTNLDVGRQIFHSRFPTRLQLWGGRLFTLSQGHLSIELPEGHGIPILSDQSLELTTQALNHNIHDRTVEVRHRISIEFVRDRDLASPLIPLIQHGSQVLGLLEGKDGHFGMASEEIDPQTHGPGCSVAEDAGDEIFNVLDRHGRRFTSFWVVPPGRKVDRTRVTNRLDLPYDTTAHYIVVHLHPFAESIELRDMTAGETVFKSKVRKSDGIGIAELGHYSSVDGLPLYKSHDYELISTYNNTSGVNQDAMASMFLYLRAQDLYDFDFRPRRSRSP